MDTATAAAIVGIAKYGGDVVKPLLNNILGPVTEATGDFLAAPLKHYNARRVAAASQVIDKAAALLDSTQTPPTSVPMYLLHPLLLGCSLQEDDELQNLWAAMLANAAAPHREVMVLPAFTSILSELSPVEVIILEALHQREVEGRAAREQHLAGGPAVPPTIVRPRREMILATFGIEDSDYEVLAANLTRLQLCTKISTDEEPDQGLTLNRLGRALMVACHYE